MKKLIVIRHAEAEQNLETSADFNRALTESGKLDAARMADLLLKKGTVPQIIISSSALRAVTTAHIFTVTLGLKDAAPNIKIYEANVNSLLQIITGLNDQHEAVGLVGHNPGISNLLYALTGKITTMPTAAWAEIELEVDSWSEVSGDTGKFIQYQYP